MAAVVTVVTLDANRRRHIQCLAVSNQNKYKDEKICETGSSLGEWGYDMGS